jgi:predicted esterase
VDVFGYGCEDGRFCGSEWLASVCTRDSAVLGGDDEEETTTERAFVQDMMAAPKQSVRDDVSKIRETPVSIGHGIDDELVDVKLGREARDVLVEVGYKVDWREYEGAEQEGHWLKEREEVEDIVGFLERNSITEH